MSTPAPGVLALCRLIADRMIEQGARAVWLAGSHARGEATEHSDIDLGALAARPGEGPGYRLERREGHLVSVAWTTEEATRASFGDPAVLGAAVAGWRNAVLVRDPHGVAARLRDEARAWRWTGVESACDAWVAEQVTGYAEEVHKLRAALDAGRRSTAAVQRNVLALSLPVVLSVHLRILYDSENVLWDAVAAAAADAEWRAAQSAALCDGGETLERSCAAALRLYALAAEAARDVLDERQRAVVEHAVALASDTVSGE